ncbi:transglutaminase family protein [Aurantibacter sp.]|uniref:transglutaminase-like domain-containing protein n=1 Tax=Aurantibacter sp. TaxID=2807103 RepID=UPI0032638C6C
MFLEYSIVYKAENDYANWVNDAHWQFLIIPEKNKTQEFVSTDFKNSLNAKSEYSINGYGFKTIRLSPKVKFKKIAFEASFRLLKREVNPYDFDLNNQSEEQYGKLLELDFQIQFERFIKKSNYTSLSKTQKELFIFDKSLSIFENLQNLNKWTFNHLVFKAEVTNVYSDISDILLKQQGVCQDFTHLFCALARQNGIPTRYVSGYLHQGNGYFGDSQMHAWAEAYIPQVGWIGFDPTNNLLANTNHIKVAHGKDYTDCSPLKGILNTSGANKTKHSVQVVSQQQQ